MELRVDGLESLDGQEVPNGCFVGIRLGDRLKQHRYDPATCYHFPLPERRRNAKIDVYRLIGTSNAVIDPEMDSSEELKVVGTSSMPDLRLKLSASVRPGAVQDGKKKRDEHVTELRKAADDYLAKHYIAERMGEAVRQLLHKRPDDPFEFLSSYLKTVETTMPLRVVKAAAGPASLAQFKVYHKSYLEPRTPQPFWNSLHARFPAPKGAIRLVAPLPNEAKPAVLPFRGYYQKYLQPRSKQASWERLYTRFPGATRGREVETSSREIYAAGRTLKSGSLPPHAKIAWNLRGLRSPASMSPDERVEVERTLSRSLLELNGELAGEYFPLSGSPTSAWSAGMSAEEESLLKAEGCLFGGDTFASGIFTNAARDMVVWVNGDHHVQFIQKQKGLTPQDTVAKLSLLVAAVRVGLQQDGHDFAEPVKVVRSVRGVRPPAAMSAEERCEVERIVTRALESLTGELEGTYVPMSPGSPGLVGGVSQELIPTEGLVYRTSDDEGRGAFTTAGGATVFINAEEHVMFVAKAEGRDTQRVLDQLSSLEAAVDDALQRDGFALA
mmetsp:Transcript_4063/g.9593  ORF Transcript_4063/g.9593 Transcript_4063/m.9593 type:complete len:555 (+) Transcript_4063:73-1737(+)